MQIIKMNKEQVLAVLDDMFEIIYSNMTKIVGIEHSKEEDYKTWKNSMLQVIDDKHRRWIGAFDNNELVGYFIYSVDDNCLKMHEVQLKPDRQGDKETFISLTRSLLDDDEISDDYKVYLVVNNKNKRSEQVVEKLGFQVFEEYKRNKKYINDFANLKEHINNYDVKTYH